MSIRSLLPLAACAAVLNAPAQAADTLRFDPALMAVPPPVASASFRLLPKPKFIAEPKAREISKPKETTR